MASKMPRVSSWAREALAEIDRAIAAGEIEIARQLWRFAEEHAPSKHAVMRICAVGRCGRASTNRLCWDHRTGWRAT